MPARKRQAKTGDSLPDFMKLLFLLFSSVDSKIINLLRFYELQIDLLERRLKLPLRPSQVERAALPVWPLKSAALT